MTALNPVYTIGFQIGEMLRSHQAMSPKAARRRAIELLTMVEIPNPERRVDSYPHQLSGGQRQRAMIAQALACDPELLLADEPTTALDVTVQAEILKLMRDLKHRIDAAIVLITHDMGVVADMADRVHGDEGWQGRRERAPRKRFSSGRSHPYTVQLLDAVPHLGAVIGDEPSDEPDPSGRSSRRRGPTRRSAARPPQRGRRRRVPTAACTAPGWREDAEPVVTLDQIAIEYPKRGRDAGISRGRGRLPEIGRGEVMGLVGESGSGKTTIGRAMVGLLPIVAGRASLLGTELVGIDPKSLRELRRKVSFVFQDPGSSLNPRLPDRRVHRRAPAAARRGQGCGSQQAGRGPAGPRAPAAIHAQPLSARTLRRTAATRRDRPRSLALEPQLLIADEPTSALDVSVQARVLDLFQELQREKGFACLFISHDLAVVEILSRRIAVMHHGHLVELGTREQILNSPAAGLHQAADRRRAGTRPGGATAPTDRAGRDPRVRHRARRAGRHRRVWIAGHDRSRRRAPRPRRPRRPRARA